MLLQALQMDGEANSLVYHDFETTAGARTIGKGHGHGHSQMAIAYSHLPRFGKRTHLVFAAAPPATPSLEPRATKDSRFWP